MYYCLKKKINKLHLIKHHCHLSITCFYFIFKSINKHTVFGTKHPIENYSKTAETNLCNMKSIS